MAEVVVATMMRNNVCEAMRMMDGLDIKENDVKSKVTYSISLLKTGLSMVSLKVSFKSMKESSSQFFYNQ